MMGLFFSNNAIILHHCGLTLSIPLDIEIIGLNEMKDLSYPFLRDTFLQSLEDSGMFTMQTEARHLPSFKNFKISFEEAYATIM